jgi:hypothetical protein
MNRTIALTLSVLMLLAGCSTVAQEPTRPDETAPEVKATQEPLVQEVEELQPELFEPIPPVLEVPVTWENLLERADEIHAINYNDTYATIERNMPLLAEIEVARSYFRGPGLGAKHYADLETWLANTDALYARSVTLDSQIFLMFPFQDVEWAIEKLADPEINHPFYEDIIRNANETPRQGIRQNAVPDMVPGRFDGIWSLPATLDGYYGFSGLARNEAAMIYHEQVHQHQQAQWKDENLNGPNFGMGQVTPCFIVEGMATTPEFALISDSVSEYEGFVRDRVRGAYTSDPDTRDELGNFTGYSELTDSVTVEYAENYLRDSFGLNCTSGLQYGLSYSLGYLATEALVAIKGYESPMGLLTLMGQNELQWDEAFQHIFEISWDEAMPILAQYVSLKALEYRG